MRCKGFMLFIGLIIIIGVITLVFIDQWIETGLEINVEKLAGAKVDIDNLDFNLAGLSLSWDRLQITDRDNTMQNTLETGRVAFNINALALFRKRIIIDEMTLADVRSGTPRSYDGALPKKKKTKKTKTDMFDKAKARLTNEIEQMPVMNFDMNKIQKNLNLDSLITLADIKSVDRIDSAKTEIVRIGEKWETFFNAFKPDKDLKKIQSDFSKMDIKKIDTLPEILSAINKVNKHKKKLKKIAKTVTSKHKEITQDFNLISQYKHEADIWFKEDYNNLLAKAQLPDLSVSNISKILFGKSLMLQVEKYLGYLQTARKLAPKKKSGEPEKKKPPRLKGQDIQYTDKLGWPEFLIKKIHISGQTGTDDDSPGLMLSGNINGLTNQPWVYGKPAVIDLKGLTQDKMSGLFKAVLDHTQDTASDQFDITVKNISLNHFNLAETPYLPTQIEKGRMDVNNIIRLTGDNLLIQMDMTAREVDFDFSKQKTSDQFVTIVQDVISKMDALTLQVKVTGNMENPAISFKSNMDNLVSNRLKQIGSKAITDAQNKIRNRLNSIRKDKMVDINGTYADNEKNMKGKMDGYNDQIGDLEKQFKKMLKELEKSMG